MDNANPNGYPPSPPTPPAMGPSPNMDTQPKWPKIIKVIAIVVAVLALLGLGWFIWQKQKTEPTPAVSSTDTFKKTGYDDACALVSKEQVEAAFGLQFEEFTKDQFEYRAGLTEENSSCTINEEHEKTAKGALEFTSLQIAVDNFASAEEAKHKLDVMRQSVVVDGQLLDVATDVPGLGNEAFFSKNQVSGATQEYLFVLKDNRLFHFVAVKLNGIDSEKVRPPMVEIARKAVE